MKYFSTQHNSPLVDFAQACIQGLAPDGGLYFPATIPVFSKQQLKEMKQAERNVLAHEVMKHYVGDSLPDNVLLNIVTEAFNFPVPLVWLNDSMATLEMYHGNTLAFKDLGARFMSRCLGYFVRGENQKVTVLVATSGDTGAAVADGFFSVEGVQVVILYPKGKVSSVQEKQLSARGGNIHAIAINGSFDDCQSLVKAAMANTDLTDTLFLTSANSINVARWLPQQLFYFFADQQWTDPEPPVVAVPSGNFGNICAGMLAAKSGLPVKRFIAACNANDAVVDFLENGNYAPKKTVATISNAMDVGNPSNLARIFELYGKDAVGLNKAFSALRFSDVETSAVIQQVWKDIQYMLDPHAAVGYLALTTYLNCHADEKGYFAETAHPVKFFDVLEPIIGEQVPQPERIKALMEEPSLAITMEVDINCLKDYLLSLPK